MGDEGNEMNPKVFISYSHDSEDFKDWVRAFADRLIGGGVDVTLDQYDLKLGKMIPHFMEKGISENDYVLLLISPEFVRKAKVRQGGVGFEVDLVAGEIIVSNNRRKFIPVLVKVDFENVPPFLKGVKGIRITNLFSYDKEYRELYETITGQSLQKPSLGAIRSVTALDQEDDPFDVVRLGKKKQLQHYCYLNLRFDAANLKGFSVAELYSAIQKHITFEDIHGFLRANPYIFSPTNKKRNVPEVVYESTDYAANYTNVIDYDKFVIAQGRFEYSFIGYKTDKPFYFSSDIAQATLMMLVPILRKVHEDAGARVDVTVTIKVKSSSNATFQNSGRPLPVKGQIWENYVHHAGTTVVTVNLHALGSDDAERLFNRMLEVFVSDNPGSSMPFLQVDKKDFMNVFKEIADRTP